jgi:hypothetical protein
VTIDYRRQEGLKDLAIPRAATVVGTGAVGCWVAYFAALAGTQRLLLYTIGSVKRSDLARFPFAPDLLGKPYAFALPQVLLSIRPEIELIIGGEFRPDTDRVEGVVFNCAASDDVSFDLRLYELCQKEKLRYISGGYSEHTAYVTDHVPEVLPRPSLDPVPTWAGAAALAGLQAVYTSAANSDEHFCRSVNLVAGISELEVRVHAPDDYSR